MSSADVTPSYGLYRLRWELRSTSAPESWSSKLRTQTTCQHKATGPWVMSVLAATQVRTNGRTTGIQTAGEMKNQYRDTYQRPRQRASGADIYPAARLVSEENTGSKANL